jgi:hypothetical protein
MASCTHIVLRETSKKVAPKSEPIPLNAYQRQELLKRFTWKDFKETINGDNLLRVRKYRVLSFRDLYNDTSLHERNWKMRKDIKERSDRDSIRFSETKLSSNFYFLKIFSNGSAYYKWFIVDGGDSIHFQSGYEGKLNDTNILNAKIGIINAIGRKYKATFDTAKFRELIYSFEITSFYVGNGYITVPEYRKKIFKSKEDYETYNKIYYENDSLKLKEFYGEETTDNPLTDYMLCEIEYAYCNDYFSVSYKRLKTMRQRDFYEK